MGVGHRAATGTGAQAGKVVAADWSADHVHVPFEVALLLANGNTPHVPPASVAAGTELFSTAKPTRNLIDLAQATQVRFTAMVTANGNATGAAVKLQYRPKATEAATWTGTDAGPTIVLGTGTVGIMRESGWVTLAAGARVADCVIAAVVSVAFGTTSPSIGSLTAYFR
jgi:hypothetical protein